jgi:hypothetical protein
MGRARNPVDIKHPLYAIIAELDFSSLLNGTRYEFGRTLVGLEYSLPNISVELLEVKNIQVFQPLPQKRSTLPDIILVKPRLSLVKANIDVPEVFNGTPPALILFMH